MNKQRCSHGAVRRHEPIIAKQSKRPTGAWLEPACIVRGIFVLLTLAAALCVTPFALAQQRHGEFGRGSLTSPSSLTDHQKQQVQTAPNSVKNRHQASVSKQGAPRPAPQFQGIPSGIDCDTAPGIVIHDDGTVESGYVSGPGIPGIFADKFTPAVYPSSYTSVCLAFNTLCGGPRSQAVEIVVFADDGPGGSPGTELGSLPVTITSLPVFPDPVPAWSSFDISSLNIIVNSGSVYIGARWAPDGLPETFLASDENGPGFGGGYYFDSFRNVWTPIQAFFPSYRAMFVRAVEQVDGLAVVSTDPAVGSVVFTQPVDFVVNVREPVQSATLQASDFTVNGIAADSVDYIPGTTTMTFHFTSTPVTTQGAQTMHIDEGAFLSDPAGDPVHEFNGTFHYDVSLLQVNSTVPPVGGTFSPPAPGAYDYNVNWNEAVDPTSVQTSDLTLSGISGATVTAVSVINGNMTTRFTLNIPSGGSLTASIAAGAITDQFGNPSNAFSGNYTVSGCPPDQYVITPGTGGIVPGDTDIGNHCDECDTFIALPFNFQLYGTTYTGVNVSSNGRLDFVNANEPGGYATACPPSPPNPLTGLSYDNTIFVVWQDLRTDGGAGCANFPGGTCGVFTSVTGNPPNRIFNIEWRAVSYDDDAAAQNFEVRLYENDPNQRFDVVIGTLTAPRFLIDPRHWVSGVQGNSNLGMYTEDFCICPPSVPVLNVTRTYALTHCAAPSPTPTPTSTPTATSTPRPTPTPRSTPLARPRPTPPPRP